MRLPRGGEGHAGTYPARTCPRGQNGELTARRSAGDACFECRQHPAAEPMPLRSGAAEQNRTQNRTPSRAKAPRSQLQLLHP